MREQDQDPPEAQLDPEAQDPVEVAELGPDENPEIVALLTEIEKLTREKQDLHDQLLRSIAEFQNYRKRSEQEAKKTRAMAAEKLVTSLLPVLDNFERTLAAVEAGADPEAIREGIRAIDRLFRATLADHQVSRIQAHGQPFDPEHHEAIAIEESNEHPEDTVVGEIEPGYRMADKVIRPARVRVARKP